MEGGGLEMGVVRGRCGWWIGDGGLIEVSASNICH